MRHLITQKKIKIVRHFLYCTFRDLKYQNVIQHREALPNTRPRLLLAARVPLINNGYTMEHDITIKIRTLARIQAATGAHDAGPLRAKQRIERIIIADAYLERLQGGGASVISFFREIFP